MMMTTKTLELALPELDLERIGIVLLAAFSVGAVVYVLVFPYLSGEKKTEKRVSTLSERKQRADVRSGGPTDNSANRRKQVEDTLKELEEKKKKDKVSMRLRLQRAGLSISPRMFWILSAFAALAVGAALLVSGAPPAVAFLGLFAGGLGLPRWILGYMTKRRIAAFLEEFANAIDVVVRGVKSGLPLNDCLKIISQEAEEPVRSEFREVVEQQGFGIPLSQCFERMFRRVPVQEVNFFTIVLVIQQQSGGNLAEALGNLSAVLRDRKRLKRKVLAMSMEAKASAAIIGALPLVVLGVSYFSNPGYISLLWTEELGQLMLAGSAVWMFIGVMVMRKMINIDI